MTTLTKTHNPTRSTGASAAPEWLDKNLYPFESRFVNIEGHRIHYIVEGNGPTLLMIHSSPSWSFLYRNIIHDLKDSFRCIAIDLPGFGLSQAGDHFENTLMEHSRLFEEFIRHLNLKDVTLFLHGQSVSAGLGVVGRNPDWFKGAIVSNSFAWPLEAYPKVTGFLKFVSSKPFGWAIQYFNFFTKYFSANLNGGTLTEAERNAYRGPFNDPKTRRHLQQGSLASILTSHDYLVDLEKRLLKISSDFPILIAFGDGDAAFEAGWVDRYEKMFPRHHTYTIEGGDHFPQERDPHGIAKAIKNWHQDLIA